MTTLVFFLEELSARALLEGLLPRVIGAEVAVRYVVFEGKQDLEAQLVRKLRGWQAPDAAFIVLRDQDAAECKAVKERLTALVAESGQSALVRVACRELEAWVAGDLEALSEAFDEPRITGHARKAKFRDPDSLVRPIEELRRLVPEYQKVDGARRVGKFLHLTRNTSKSFRAFCDGLQRLLTEAS